MTGALQHAWLRRGALARLLLPVALLFQLLASLRRGAYRLGWLRRDRWACRSWSWATSSRAARQDYRS